MVAYAESKGLRIHEPAMFDGDIYLLKEQIDIISDIRAEYGLDNKLTISFRNMPDSDMAQSFTNSINFNTKVLRDRNVTNRILSADNRLAANDIRGIAAHEMGHQIAQKYGDKGLDIFVKTVYNVDGRSISTDEAIEMLKNEISSYSVQPHSPFSEKKKYKEVISEMLSCEATMPNKYTSEFIRLLKEAYGL